MAKKMPKAILAHFKAKPKPKGKGGKVPPGLANYMAKKKAKKGK